MGRGGGFREKPRRGSLQVWPRKRARRSYPRIRNWASKKTPELLGFAGYKAGMTHVIAVDNRPGSPTKGEDIMIPVTVLETPDIKVAALRLYSSSLYGLNVVSEVWSDSLDEELARKIKLPKKPATQQKLQDAESKLDKMSAVRVLAYTQPKLAAFGKKKPELIELAIGGDVKAQFDFAKSILGKSIGIDKIFQAGQLLDIHAVTKGKGFQGVIKRFGAKLKPHKTEKGRRRIGTLGAWRPCKTSWSVAQPGQMGYHTRTEYNKQLLKIGENGEEVTPSGGFVRYGAVKGKYALIAGSVAGPKKRLIKLTCAIRAPKKASLQAPEIVSISKRPQQ